MSNPLISVIMSVYNTKQEYLRISIESILAQSFGDFEFIIVDDCSTDGSLDIIQEYAGRDKRIVVICNENNLGLTKSLNIALKKAKGKYIARMDADDYSVPNRFQIQVNYLEKHIDVGAVGGYGYVGKKRGRALTYWVKQYKHLKASMMLRNSGIPHPSAMFRRVMPDGYVVCYDEEIKKSQDFALWAEIIRHGKIKMLHSFMIIYRVHPNQISAQNSSQRAYSRKVIQKQVIDYLKVDAETAEQISHLSDISDQLDDAHANPLFDLIIEANNREKALDSNSVKWIVNEMKHERYYISKVSKNRPRAGLLAFLRFVDFYYITRIKYDVCAFFFVKKHRRIIESVLGKSF